MPLLALWRIGPLRLRATGTAIGAKHLIMIVYGSFSADDPSFSDFVPENSRQLVAIVSIRPVEFLADEYADAYGWFVEELMRPVLERSFILDDEDRTLNVKRLYFLQPKDCGLTLSANRCTDSTSGRA